MKTFLDFARDALLRVVRQVHSSRVVACAECFRDVGLRLSARNIGLARSSRCPNCGSVADRKLTRAQLEQLAYRFFVWGSLQRAEYGAAPLLQSNHLRKSDIDVGSQLREDIRIFENAIGAGFFYYGPRLWMIGEVEPLKALQTAAGRDAVLRRIVHEYPRVSLLEEDKFFRIRVSPYNQADPAEYDSPPLHLAGTGRLDSADWPVLYGSPDLEVCLHECRVAAEDENYVATLQPCRELRLLDLSHLLEEDVSEFESLDMAVHMLFLAGKHAYEHTRSIARASQAAGFDGVIYPSYFSLLRVGAMPFETAFGLSVRRFPGANVRERRKTVPNIAVFGRPVAEGRVRVSCINRVVLRR